MEDEGSANELAQLDRAFPPLLPLDSDLQMERVLAGRSHVRYHRRRHARPAGDPSLSLSLSLSLVLLKYFLVSVWMMRKSSKKTGERVSYSISTKLDSCFMIIFFSFLCFLGNQAECFMIFIVLNMLVVDLVGRVKH